MPVSLSELSLCEAAERIRLGEVTVEEYARELLARCEAGRSLNAFISLDPEPVLKTAREADRRRRRGESPGPLHGIPLAIKDVFDVAGTPTTAGTPGLEDNAPSRTAPLVERLFDAGAIMLGKTNMHELAFGVTSANEFTGAIRNPYDATRSSGGSSGGTAAAIAARMAPSGLGSDTGGSSRIPAAHCGIVGHRPSTGRYPTAGMVPMNHTRDAPGFMARSVADIALLDEIVSGADTIPPVALEDLRIGLPREHYFSVLDSRVDDVIAAELRRLRDLGVEFVEADPSAFLTERSRTTVPIMAWEFPRNVARYLNSVGHDVGVAALVDAVASPYVASELEEVLDAADDPDLADRYHRAITDVVPRLRAEYRAYFRGNDLSAIAFPTSPLAPVPIGEHECVTVDGEEVSVWHTLRNTVPTTILGAPGLTVPVGLTEDGLPVGLELDGLPHADRALLAIGLEWERASDGLPAPGQG